MAVPTPTNSMLPVPSLLERYIPERADMIKNGPHTKTSDMVRKRTTLLKPLVYFFNI